MSDETARLLRSLTDEVLGSADAAPTWDALRELDWPLVGIPEDDGGAGGELADILALAEGIGRNATDLPLAAAHAAFAAAAAGGHAELLAQRLVVSTAPDPGSVMVTDNRDSVSIAGTARRVPWARAADTILVQTPDYRWVAIDPAHPAVAISAGANLAGEARDDVSFTGLVVPMTAAWRTPEPFSARELLLGCAATVGAIEATTALTSRYVGDRAQFGRPLRDLQAVGQSVAMMRVHSSAARAALAAAADTQESLHVLAAHVDIAEYARRVARTAHDLHGAMGVTQEYPLHRLTTRLWAWPEEGVRQREARARLGEHAAARGAAQLWTDLISGQHRAEEHSA